jgi:hypothetical protein
MSCDKENEIVGKWQIIDIQFEEVDTIGLAGLVFTTLSEHLSRPTTLLVESDSIYMFADNEIMISKSYNVISEKERFYQLKVGEDDASFKLENSETAVFYIKNMSYFLKEF